MLRRFTYLTLTQAFSQWISLALLHKHIVLATKESILIQQLKLALAVSDHLECQSH